MTSPLARSLDRRTLLLRGIQASGLLAAGPLLGACGGGPAPATKGLGTLAIRLAWVKDVEFAGEYLADTRGYYKAQGFTGVDLITGGPTATPAETDVQTGKAFVGISSPDITGAAIEQGATLKIVAAQYQKSPFAIMSMAKTPLRTAQDMIGKKIGVQATNEAVWDAFLKANKIAPSSITKVPVQFDPLPLTTGTVDGWLSYVDNEPNILLLKGYDVTTFLLADQNYPLVGETYVVTDDSLKNHRDKVKAMLIAEIKGWKDNIADPQAGADLAVNTYGKGLGLDPKAQALQSKQQTDLITSPDTRKNGIFTVTPELIAANIATLKYAGVNVTADQLFDMSVINEIYKENPGLV